MKALQHYTPGCSLGIPRFDAFSICGAKVHFVNISDMEALHLYISLCNRGLISSAAHMWQGSAAPLYLQLGGMEAMQH